MAAVVAALVGASSVVSALPDATASGSAPPSFSVPSLPLGSFLEGDQSVERRISGATWGVIKEVRRYFRTLGWMFGRALDWWGNWIKRAFFYIGVAVVAALVDSSLVTAVRSDGLRILTSHVPMMLYVYGRLLFSSGVKLAPKLVLLGSFIYGMVWRDLIPDRDLVPGQLEDIALIIIAIRAFVYACPEALLEQYAQNAVRLRNRFGSSGGASPR